MLTWNINPIAFHLGNSPIRYYSLCFTGALLTGYLGHIYIQNRFAKNSYNVDLFSIGAIISCFFGTRLFHLVFYQWNDFLRDPLLLFDFSRGGLASHGALAMIALFAYLFARMSKISALHLSDLFCVFAPLGAAWVRVGNFFNSEIIGRTTDVPWGVIFERVDKLPRHPVQIYECLLLIFTFCLNFWGAHKKGWLSIRGRTTGIFLFVYFGGRLLLEFTKELQVPIAEQWMTMGQWLSIAPALLGIYFLFVRNRPLSTI